MKKKKLNIILPIIIITFIFSILFFNFSLIVTPDGSKYYWYTSIIEGKNSISSWDLTRGPTFPLILTIFKNIFGNNSVGLLIGFYLLNLIMLFISLLIIKQLLHKNGIKTTWPYWALYIVLLVFNPIIIGYSHTLLTETVAPAIIMLNLYLILKWKEINWNISKTKSIVYSLIFSFLLIIMWFLKQPYVVILFFMLLISIILICLEKKDWKIFVEKTATLAICGVLLVMSIGFWNFFLEKNGIDTNDKNSSSSFIARGIISGLNAYYSEIPKDIFCGINYINSSLLEQKEKDNIVKLSKKDKNWCDKILIFNVHDFNNQIKSQSAIIFKNQELSTKDSIKHLITNTTKNPLLTLSAYYHNYLAVINLVPVEIFPNNKGYKPGNRFTMRYEHENEWIGLLIYSNTTKCWWQNPNANISSLQYEEIKMMKKFEGVENHNSTLEKIIRFIAPIYLNIFKILFLLCLPLSIIYFIKFKKNSSDCYYLLTIICFSSFIHVLFHACMGALIDRYAYVAYPMLLLGVIIIFLSLSKKGQELNS